MKTSMKRIVSIALILCLTLALLPSAFAAGSLTLSASNTTPATNNTSFYLYAEGAGLTGSTARVEFYSYNSGSGTVKEAIANGAKLVSRVSGTVSNGKISADIRIVSTDLTSGWFTYNAAYGYAGAKITCSDGTEIYSNWVQIKNPMNTQPVLAINHSSFNGRSFEILTDVSNIGGNSYTYSIYRNTIDSIYGGTLLYSNTTKTASNEYWTSFEDKTQEYYYYYFTVVYGQSTYYSNIMKVENPEYSTNESSVVKTINARIGEFLNVDVAAGMNSFGFSVVSDTLYNYGLSCNYNPVTGLFTISGTPTKNGTGTIIYKLTSLDGTKIVNYTLNVAVSTLTQSDANVAPINVKTGETVNALISAGWDSSLYSGNVTYTGLTGSGLAPAFVTSGSTKSLVLAGTANNVGIYPYTITVTRPVGNVNWVYNYSGTLTVSSSAAISNTYTIPVTVKSGDSVKVTIDTDWASAQVVDIVNKSGFDKTGLTPTFQASGSYKDLYLTGTAGTAGTYSVSFSAQWIYDGKTYVNNYIIPLTITPSSVSSDTKFYTVDKLIVNSGDKIAATVDTGWGATLSPSVTSTSGLTNTGLAAEFKTSEYGDKSLYLTGTADKVGTYDVKVTAQWLTSDGKTLRTNIYTIPVEIKAAVPEDTPLNYNLTANKNSKFEYNISHNLGKAGYTGYATTNIEGKLTNLSEFGLGATLSANGISIVGTPTKSGKAYLTAKYTKSGKNCYVYVTIDVLDAALSVRLEKKAASVDTIVATVAGSNNYTYSLYVNSVSKQEGASPVFTYANKPATTSTVEMVHSLYGLKEKTYYYFVVVASNGKTATSNILAVNNPYYTEEPAFVNPFTDVKENDWFYKDVMSAKKMGLIDGMTPTTFVPDGKLTIAQAIKLAACMNQYFNDKKVTLTNSATGNWYDSYVNYAVSKGIITANQFAGKYGNTATRADYVMIFANALPASEFTAINYIADNKIPDVKTTDACGAAVYKLYRAGILTGYTDRSFAPNNSITRAEVAAVLARMMDKNARVTFTIG